MFYLPANEQAIETDIEEKMFQACRQNIWAKEEIWVKEDLMCLLGFFVYNLVHVQVIES